MTTRSHTADRTFRLRRPPRLELVEGRFVPRVELDEVERRWSRLRELNPRYFDGGILHVLGASRDGHGGVTVHVVETSYRFYAVQRATPEETGPLSGLDCGVRPLGAKAIATCDGKYLLGRRSDSVAYYPNEWEFVPGGGLEPGDDPTRCVLRELAEETHFEPLTPPVAIALLYDSGALSWEVVHRIELRARGGAPAPSGGWEHGELALVDPGAWPTPLCRVARAMAALVGDRTLAR